MIGADLVADDRADADADPAPERDRRDRPEHELRRPSLDRASGGCRGRERMPSPIASASPSPITREDDPGEQARGVLGRDHDRSGAA